MLPLRDELPTRRVPVITIGLIAVNVLVFLLEIFLELQGEKYLEAFLWTWGTIPWELTHNFGPRSALSLLTSMFLHGGFLHIGGNMLYLWIFGNNVEDEMGRWQFTVFYLLCGVLAGLAQVAAGPDERIPAIGASGAIAGVLGAYLVLFPRARVATLVIFGYFIRVAYLPAALLLGFWFVLQLLNGFVALSSPFQSSGVAWFAHIGGFIAGLLLVWLFARRRRRPAPPAWPSRYGY
ncbi:MAG: rhomboid family intramembrane serine protease [Chloroflexia bacterium]